MTFEELFRSMDETVITLEDNNFIDAEIKSGRKRMRLHQLSWEEKIQRKKLRNRIAAQTSRDRKKARMDHLEGTVKELLEKNEDLSFQIAELKKQNESLLTANSDLQKALSTRSTSRVFYKPSAEGKECIDGISEELNFMDSLESLPSLPINTEMLGDLKGNTFFDDLERLATSLLEEVEQYENGRVDASLEKQFSTDYHKECSSFDEVVGKTSEKLESSRISSLSVTSTSDSNSSHVPHLTKSEFIMNITLEHSYAQQANLSRDLDEFLKFKPQDSSQPQCPKIEITEVDEVDLLQDSNPDEEAFQTDNQGLDLPSQLFPNYHSPRSDLSSDMGYESLGSPTYSEFSGNDNFEGFFDRSLPDLFPELF